MYNHLRLLIVDIIWSTSLGSTAGLGLFFVW